jgi:hypothetical protein
VRRVLILNPEISIRILLFLLQLLEDVGVRVWVCLENSNRPYRPLEVCSYHVRISNLQKISAGGFALISSFFLRFLRVVPPDNQESRPEGKRFSVLTI